MFNVKAIENWNHLATVRFEEGMSSTQDVAKQLAHSGDTAFPALVLTAHQTAGRSPGI